MSNRTSAFPAETEKAYEYSAPARPRPSLPKRRARRWVAPFLCVFGFASAAALSVCALLARADLTVLRDECEQLEAQIEELANEHDHLVIDFETQYNISRLGGGDPRPRPRRARDPGDRRGRPRRDSPHGGRRRRLG